MPDEIGRAEGRHLFGLDPERYHSARPDYPPWIFDELTETQALFPGAATVEIGAGSGLATRHLIERGAEPLTLIEPDVRFARMLASAAQQLTACTVVHDTFEEASLPDDGFDLAVAATSFHWIDQDFGLRKLRRVLKSGGTAALIWNVFHDPDRYDAFHHATNALLAPLAVSPSGAPNSLPFALDRHAREADARCAGFTTISYSESRWSFALETEQIGKLYEGFSQIQRLDGASRAKVLDELKRIADEQFGGVVERHVVSCLYRLQ